MIINIYNSYDKEFEMVGIKKKINIHDRNSISKNNNMNKKIQKIESH